MRIVQKSFTKISQYLRHSGLYRFRDYRFVLGVIGTLDIDDMVVIIGVRN